MPAIVNMVGMRFGRLVVLERGEPPHGVRRRSVYWKALCDCGNRFVSAGDALRIGATVSCGCFRRDNVSEYATTHGMTKTPEYRAWAQMRQRCLNPSDARYASYGGRGIRICAQWESFDNFLADMGTRLSPQHSLDRKDNNGDYEPNNCRWATRRDQQNNRRTNRRLTAFGYTMSLAEWARKLGRPPATLAKRLKAGWPVERALAP